MVLYRWAAPLAILPPPRLFYHGMILQKNIFSVTYAKLELLLVENGLVIFETNSSWLNLEHSNYSKLRSLHMCCYQEVMGSNTTGC